MLKVRRQGSQPAPLARCDGESYCAVRGGSRKRGRMVGCPAYFRLGPPCRSRLRDVRAAPPDRARGVSPRRTDLLRPARDESPHHRPLRVRRRAVHLHRAALPRCFWQRARIVTWQLAAARGHRAADRRRGDRRRAALSARVTARQSAGRLLRGAVLRARIPYLVRQSVALLEITLLHDARDRRGAAALADGGGARRQRPPERCSGC